MCPRCVPESRSGDTRPVSPTVAPALMNRAEVARLLGVSKDTARRLATDGTITAVKLGPKGRWRFIRASVEAIIRETPSTPERTAA
jgi:excisionase family DNA binding protein